LGGRVEKAETVDDTNRVLLELPRESFELSKSTLQPRLSGYDGRLQR